MSFQVVLLCFVMVVTSSVNKHSFLNERTKHETSESEESPLGRYIFFKVFCFPV